MQRTSRTSRGGAKPSSGAKKPQERWHASAAKERTDVVARWNEKAADLNEVIEEMRPGAAARGLLLALLLPSPSRGVVADTKGWGPGKAGERKAVVAQDNALAALEKSSRPSNETIV